MIKINLAPIDELQNKYWYLPEVIMGVVTLAASFYSIQVYLDGVRNDLALVTSQVQTKETDLIEITKETSRYEQLDRDISKLNVKLEALKKITVSKISRLKPVVLIEHLQNLKPEGVWFNYVSDNPDSNKITVVGKSFDNILVAEFMTAIAATKTQEMDESDLRTQVFFDDVKLERISTTGSTGSASSGSRRGSGSGGQSAPEEFVESVSEHWTSTDRFFPELVQFPSFHLTLSYKERVPKPKPAEILNN